MLKLTRALSNSIILSFLAISGANSLSEDGKCRILALRGGGVHGSYEVGVLNSLVDILPIEEL